MSAIHAGLLAAAFLSAGLATALVSRDAAERDLRARIQVEADGIAQAIAHGGLESGVVAIDARAEQPGALEYRLVTPDNHLAAGDLPITASPPGWAHVRLSGNALGAEGRQRLLVLTRTMPDGSRLTLGDDVSRLESVRNQVLISLAWIDGAALTIGLIISIILTHHALNRMGMVTATLKAFARNELDSRMQVRPQGGDDIDSHARAVNAMLDRIAHLVADLRHVSAEIAHDLRTPLAQALQKLERAKNEGEPASREAFLLGAENKIRQALRLFEAMLRLAEIDAGAARARFAPIDLAEIAERMADAYRLDIENSGRRLELAPLEPCVIEGDEELIDQALANLIENAMRYTADGATIHVGALMQDARPALFVADDGPGIAADMRERALEPFGRLDPSRGANGFGLGLPIAAAVARLHGGQLKLEDAQPGLRAVLTFVQDSAA